ncbi:hypothetical protein AAC387_Pa01g2147 [Persea americana]
MEPAPRKKAPTESPEPMRKPITFANFLLPLTKKEYELQISSCNRISRLRPSSPSYSEDSDGEWVSPTMPPPIDDDDQGSDPELDLDEEKYLSDEVLHENDFITDPYFYQENIPEIEVQIYNPRLPEPSDWPVDPPSFPMPPEVHPDPLLIIDDNEPCRQVSMKALMAQDIFSSLIPVRLKDSQGGSPKKEECITTKQDIPNKVSVVYTSSGPSIPMISTLET